MNEPINRWITEDGRQFETEQEARRWMVERDATKYLTNLLDQNSTLAKSGCEMIATILINHAIEVRAILGGIKK